MSLIRKAAEAVRNAVAYSEPAPDSGSAKGVLSTWVPNLGHWWGQPNTANNGVADIYGQISVQRMREIVLKTPTAAGAINAVLDFAVGVRIDPRNVDPSQKAPVRSSKIVRNLLSDPNPQETSRDFLRKLERDIEVLGYGFVEIDRSASGNVANLWTVDAALMRVDFDKHGNILGYSQIDPVSGRPIVTPVSEGGDGVHTWTPDDILFFRLDTVSESEYPTSRVAQLYACAVIEQLMMAFIGGRFTDSNVPFGVMDLGDITEEDIKTAIALWNQQVEENQHPEHRIMFTGSKGGAKWLPFGYSLGELEAPELLSRVRLQILGILGVTVQELGEADDVNKSNGYNLSFTFKERAIKPLLDVVTLSLTKFLLHQRLGFNDLELTYEEIDSRDELLQSQIDDIRLKMGLVSVNHVRNRDGLPSTPGGDECYVYLGASVIPVSLLKDFAKVQLEALQMLNLQTQVGIQQALQAMLAPQVDPITGEQKPPQPLMPLATMPLMRGVQPPEKFVTMDGSGSSTVKFHEPKPNLQPPAPAKPAGAPNPARARGVKQATQNAGVRKPNE